MTFRKHGEEFTDRETDRKVKDVQVWQGGGTVFVKNRESALLPGEYLVTYANGDEAYFSAEAFAKRFEPIVEPEPGKKAKK